MSRLIDAMLDLAEYERSRIPADAFAAACCSLYDWLVCGIAGRDEPLAEKMRTLAIAEGGSSGASMFGTDRRVPARMAALVNGATSHALDFDDTHFAHIGHLSVAICPAALAIGEEAGSTAEDVTVAFLLGAEAAIRAGIVLGKAHYDRGFHQTATAGSFGAAVAAGRILGLSRTQMRNALGLCATRSSGLKSQFGTMGKPYNAGVAAANGVESARLAELGMTSCEDGLQGQQGFVPTHSDAPDPDFPSIDEFLFQDISYKFHACCHGTHAMIEALVELRDAHAIAAAQIGRLSLRTNPRWLTVCDIDRPGTGLEVKFSYRWLAGMVFAGVDTASLDSFRDAQASDTQLAKFAEKVEVVGDGTMRETEAIGEIVLKDGSSLSFAHDLANRIPIDQRRARLRSKGASLLGVRAQKLEIVMENMTALRAEDLGRMLRLVS